MVHTCTVAPLEPASPTMSAYVRSRTAVAAGNEGVVGVADPWTEYSTPSRGAEARLMAMKKKYPKFTALKTIRRKSGMTKADSTRLCPSSFGVNLDLSLSNRILRVAKCRHTLRSAHNVENFKLHSRRSQSILPRNRPGRAQKSNVIRLLRYSSGAGHGQPDDIAGMRCYRLQSNSIKAAEN